MTVDRVLADHRQAVLERIERKLKKPPAIYHLDALRDVEWALADDPGPMMRRHLEKMRAYHEEMLSVIRRREAHKRRRRQERRELRERGR